VARILSISRDIAYYWFKELGFCRITESPISIDLQISIKGAKAQSSINSTANKHMFPFQLSIFDPHTMIMGEGYRRLAAFEFEEARQHFKDARNNKRDAEKEADLALQVCEDWQLLAEQNDGFSHTADVQELYKYFRRYDFGASSGIWLFKQALFEYFVNQMITAGHFYFHNNDTVADLLLEFHQPRKAEKTVLQEIKKHPYDYQLSYYLAQIQLQNHQKGEAKKNFARALLYDPCHVSFKRIEYKKLKILIDDVGAEMAPAFGWVRRILPLITVPEKIEICSEMHQEALDCYRLLLLADRAAIKGNCTARLKYQKH
jgi:hypothetical protein